jgi:hypothetical protein
MAAKRGLNTMDDQNRAFPDDAAVDVFVRHAVSNLKAALIWYEQLLGCVPAFFPNDREAVWELAEHRYLYIELLPSEAGHASSLCFVGDLDAIVAAITRRGLQPSIRETLDNGVRKVTFSDPDGNQVHFGGRPAGDA